MWSLPDIIQRKVTIRYPIVTTAAHGILFFQLAEQTSALAVGGIFKGHRNGLESHLAALSGGSSFAKTGTKSSEQNCECVAIIMTISEDDDDEFQDDDVDDNSDDKSDDNSDECDDDNDDELMDFF